MSRDEMVTAAARAIHARYRELNPTWGGEDSWDEELPHRRTEFLIMAQAAVDAVLEAMSPPF